MHLPGLLLQDLYKKSLYDTGENLPAAVKKETAEAVTTFTADAIPAAQPANNHEPLRFLGNNQKQVVVLVNYTGVSFIPDQALAFLTNILKACRLTLADVAIINIAHYPDLTYPLLQKVTAYRYLLLFDESTLRISLPVNFPAYQVQAFNNATYLLSHTLEEIEANKELKTKLWTSLKKIFGV